MNTKVKAVISLLDLFKEIRITNEKSLKSQFLFTDLSKETREKTRKEDDLSIGSLEAFNRMKALDLANEYYPNMLNKKKNPKMMKKVKTANY